MQELVQDIRYGFRSLLRTPGFAAIAVVTVALGVGANSAMFSVVNSLLLRHLPFPNSARLMVVLEKQPNSGLNILSTTSFIEWKQQGRLFSQMAAYTISSFNMTGTGDGAERISGGRASANLFSLLGVQPVLGRTFSEAEDVPGAERVAVLSHALWQNRFAGDRDVVGKTVVLDGDRYTVVGVMPSTFHVLNDTELAWTPLQLRALDSSASDRSVHWLLAFLRLPDDMSRTQAQAAADAIALRLNRQDSNSSSGMVLQPVLDYLVGNVRSPILLLMGCVGFVLLIACSNVANLLLARGSARQREISVRAALGARRARLVRQLLTESVLLAGLGSVLGLVFAAGATRVLVAIRPLSFPSLGTINVDVNVLAFTVVICVFAGVLFGIVPAIEAARVNLHDTLRDRDASRAGSRTSSRQRMVLVATETALAVMLLIGTALGLKSLWHLSTIYPGFNPQTVLTFRIAAPARLTGENVPAFYRDVLEKVRSLPGVDAAAIGRDLPMSGVDPSMPITVEGNSPPSQKPIVTRYRAIGPGYFRALQTRLLRGREFTDDDEAKQPPVVIVSESLSKEYWPGENPIGKRLQPRISGAPWYTIVGVVGDVHHIGLDAPIAPTAYYTYTQVPAALLPLVENYMTIAVRARVESSALVNSIRAAIADVDKGVPVYNVRKLADIVADTGALRRFDISLLGAFAVLAITLAMIGVYGVVSQSVTLRTREIGIRVSLGAKPREILRLLIGNGVKPALAGVVAGLIGALALTRLMSSLVYGISPTDIATFAAVTLLVQPAILLACYLPARRAMKVDPVVALRSE